MITQDRIVLLISNSDFDSLDKQHSVVSKYETLWPLLNIERIFFSGKKFKIKHEASDQEFHQEVRVGKWDRPAFADGHVS